MDHQHHPDESGELYVVTSTAKVSGQLVVIDSLAFSLNLKYLYIYIYYEYILFITKKKQNDIG